MFVMVKLGVPLYFFQQMHLLAKVRLACDATRALSLFLLTPTTLRVFVVL